MFNEDSKDASEKTLKNNEKKFIAYRHFLKVTIDPDVNHRPLTQSYVSYVSHITCDGKNYQTHHTR